MAAPPDDHVAARALAAVQMLVALHRQDLATLGLAAEPPVSLTQEYTRWAAALSTCPLDSAQARLERDCRTRLEQGEPAPLPPALLHGDWRLGNMQCRGREVRAVIDWEIWSAGDPRTDLAWLMMWASPGNPGAAYPGAFMIAPRQLQSWYEESAGYQLTGMRWVQALVRYKSAATTALLVKNARKRGEAGAHVDRMQASIAGTLGWALSFLS